MSADSTPGADNQLDLVRSFGQRWQNWLSDNGSNAAFLNEFGDGFVPERSPFGRLLQDIARKAGFDSEIEPGFKGGTNSKKGSLRTRLLRLSFDNTEIREALERPRHVNVAASLCMVLSPDVQEPRLTTPSGLGDRHAGHLGLLVDVPVAKKRLPGERRLREALAAGDQLLDEVVWKRGRRDFKPFARRTYLFWEAWSFQPSDLEAPESWLNSLGERLEALRRDLENALKRAEAEHFVAALHAIVGDRASPYLRKPAPTPTQERDTEAELVEQLEEHLRCASAVVLQGPPGTGKTHRALKLIDHLAGVDPGHARKACRWTKVGRPEAPDLGQSGWKDLPVLWEIVQLHPSYAYEDLVRGLTTTPAEGGVAFVVEDKLLVQLAKAAAKRDKPTVLILDEINRCNLSAVLGELILVLEKGYRDMPVRLQYADPARPAEATLKLPKNLWIIGTMNTADRSIAMVDFAIRRRFRFIDVEPDEEVVKAENEQRFNADVAATCVKAFMKFQELVDESERKQLAIGHSYFLLDPSLRDGEGNHVPWKQQLRERIEFEVLPLAREYAAEGYLSSAASWWRETGTAFKYLGLGESE